MQNLEFSEFITLSDKLKPYKDNSISDMDYFIKTLSSIKGKEVQPDYLIGSIIIHFASKWLPELAENEASTAFTSSEHSSESVTVSWTKKRFLVESLVGILPSENDSIPCNFLLRLLRLANMVRVEQVYISELEERVSWQLDQASLKELMMPCFSHNSTTLLDVELVLRLVKTFVNMEEPGKNRVGVMKVAKLVDSYLAEAAVDSYLGLSEFVALASALPRDARAIDDGLYRAIDTYLKAHPGVSKQERNSLCSLIDCNKLSQEACVHAAQNNRLPVRAVIQVLLSAQSKLINKHIDWSGSLSSHAGVGPELAARCFSKRETSFQQIEIKRLKEDIIELQSQCMTMEKQIEKVLEKKRGWYFSWRKLGITGFKGNRIVENEEECESGIGLKTQSEVEAYVVRGRTPCRRKSIS